ncbi:hypothetical protein K440DRAFT_601574 [Wilcoxina mikolae CBS 423.85]|nr:hypothetical protein K440DRAFT_601574 [Wilcoxina mikolae CBS 423.85]
MTIVSSDPSPFLSIPSVTATQLIGPLTTPLTTGTLSLTTPPPALSPPPKLLLQITSPSLRTYTLPLIASSTILSDSKLTYRITTVDNLTITLTFPAYVSSSAALKFEELLVAHGFLSTGLVADADDVAGALRDSAARTAEKLQNYTSQRLETRECVEPWEEKEYSERAKKVMGGTVEGTGKAAEITGRVSGAVSGAAEKVGEWIGGMMPGKKEGGKEDGVVKEAAKGAVEGVGIVGAGIAESALKVAGTVGESASRIAEHEHGPEAKKMVDGGREVMANVGKVVYDVTTGTSVVWHAGEVGFAATRAGTSD